MVKLSHLQICKLWYLKNDRLYKTTVERKLVRIKIFTTCIFQFVSPIGVTVSTPKSYLYRKLKNNFSSEVNEVKGLTLKQQKDKHCQACTVLIKMCIFWFKKFNGALIVSHTYGHTCISTQALQDNMRLHVIIHISESLRSNKV